MFFLKITVEVWNVLNGPIIIITHLKHIKRFFSCLVPFNVKQLQACSQKFISSLGPGPNLSGGKWKSYSMFATCPIGILGQIASNANFKPWIKSVIIIHGTRHWRSVTEIQYKHQHLITYERNSFNFVVIQFVIRNYTHKSYITKVKWIYSITNYSHLLNYS